MSFLNRYRRVFLPVVCIVCTGIVAALYWKGYEPLVLIEFGARDFLTRHGRKAPVDPNLVFLAIDQASVSLDGAFADEIEASPALQAMKASGWPWSRDVYPMVIERMEAAGARVIALDMLFPTERQGDEAFRASLERHPEKLVIGANFVQSGDTKSLTMPSESLIPPGDTMDPRVGYVNFWPDVDDTVRRAYYRITKHEVNGMLPAPGSEVLDSFASRILRRLSRDDLIPLEPRCFRFSEGFRPYPLWEIFVPRTWGVPPYDGGRFFRGKVVLIGPEGQWAKDFLRTPFGEIPGPELHLQALNAALGREFIHESSRAANLLSILFAGLLAWALSALIAQPFIRLAVFVAGSGVFFLVVLLLFNLQSGAVLISILPPLLAADSSGLVWLVCEHVMERMEKARTRRTLERYVSRDLVKEILDNPATILNTLGGVRRSVAVLFSDLRNFTTMAEEADSQQFVAQLNEYFTEMVRCIFESRGTLDKFIGDAVMGVWGEIHSEGPAKDVGRAVGAAIEMQAALVALNGRWQARGVRTFQMGIGINFGPVIVGNIGATGATEKMELTVIGDPVNLASRLEGLSKLYGVDMILGESAADLVTDAFHLQFIDLVQVKGRAKPLRVYSVLGPRSRVLAPDVSDYLGYYSEGVSLYRSGEFASSAEAFRRCLAIRPGEPLAAMYVERCGKLAAEPPGPDWSGVWVMTSK